MKIKNITCVYLLIILFNILFYILMKYYKIDDNYLSPFVIIFQVIFPYLLGRFIGFNINNLILIIFLSFCLGTEAFNLLPEFIKLRIHEINFSNHLDKGNSLRILIHMLWCGILGLLGGFSALQNKYK